MKFQERIDKVKEAFDMDALAAVCMAPEVELGKYGTAYHEDGGKSKFAFFYQDNQSDILAIAHMDSVQKDRDFGYAKFVSGKEKIYSPQLDDRLGVYVITELLPRLGIKTDILLTTDEESGRSTGGMFVPDPEKKYRWMFEFDRTGDDVVMYQYKTEEAFKKLVECGFKTAYGSASDISKMEDLGCLGFNFGVGYQDYHSKDAWFEPSVLYSQVAKFMKFHHKYQSEHMVYDKTAKKSITTYYSESQGDHQWHGMGGSYMSRSMGSNGASWETFENDQGRRVDGLFFSKLVWDEKTRLFVLNQSLYSRYPDTRPVPDEDILWRNCKSKVGDQYVFEKGIKWTPEEVLMIARGELIIVGGEAQKPQEATKESQQTKPLPEPVWDRNEPCQCGHAYYVHHRKIYGKNGSVDACDFWHCGCNHFRAAEHIMFGL